MSTAVNFWRTLKLNEQRSELDANGEEFERVPILTIFAARMGGRASGLAKYGTGGFDRRGFKVRTTLQLKSFGLKN